MSRESYLYDKADIELYKTNGYGGSDADINNTECFTRDIDLTMKIGANIDFSYTGSGSTDDLLLALYRRRDDSWNGSEIALWNTTIDNAGCESTYNLTIDGSYGAGHYKFGIKSSGSTDTFEIDAEMRQWRQTTTIA